MGKLLAAKIAGSWLKRLQTKGETALVPGLVVIWLGITIAKSTFVTRERSGPCNGFPHEVKCEFQRLLPRELLDLIAKESGPAGMI